MKKLIVICGLIASCFCADAQSNSAPSSVPGQILGTLQSYLINNDPTYNGWQSNHIDLWQAAVFQDVKGVAGASAVGNTLGLEVPVLRFDSNTFGLHLESITDFEQVFGDIGWQGAGVGLDYNLHQVQISFQLDADIGLKGPLTGTVVPGIEFKKASTSLNGVSPIFRYEIPIRKNPGAGRVFIGIQIPL
jgi:hypothetical protein